MPQARADDAELTSADGLSTRLVRQVRKRGLEVEITEQLGYAGHTAEGRGSGNSSNRTNPKRVTTEISEVDAAPSLPTRTAYGRR